MTTANGTAPLTQDGMLDGLAALPARDLIGTRAQLDSAEPIRDELLERMERDIRDNGRTARIGLARALIAGYAAEPELSPHAWRRATWWMAQEGTGVRTIRAMAVEDAYERRARALVELGPVRLQVGLHDDECRVQPPWRSAGLP